MRIRFALPFALACLVATVVPFVATPPSPIESTDFPGWPTELEGRALRPLPLSAVELRFATGFPGRIGRFTDGEREIILRWISSPTRKLHPAADCFKGSGYAVAPLPIEVIAGAAWSAFEAHRGRDRLRVRETIVDARGGRWTDVSSWYWSAVRDKTQRPWWAITVAASTVVGHTGATMPLARPD